MAKSGHHFPAKAGFKNSTGKVQSVSGYTRAVPKKSVGGLMQRPVGMSGPKMIPAVQPQMQRQAPIMRAQPVRRGALAYAEGGMVGGQGKGAVKSDSIGDQGNATVKRGNPPTTQADRDAGGTSPLRTGYKRGGAAKGFNKAPMFGKK